MGREPAISSAERLSDMDQLTFDLGFRPRFGADDFLVTPANRDAHATLIRWPDWPGRSLLLVGPEGAGKSHLAAIWATLAGAQVATPAEIASGRSSTPTTLVEDLDRASVPEAALFHFVNDARERGAFLLITARSPPDHWGLGTRDLLSRLRVAPLLRLEAPDEALLRAVLVKLFLDRQLVVDSSVVDYLTLRLDRSLGAARRLVDALDRASLVSQRRITRPIAAEVLAALSP